MDIKAVVGTNSWGSTLYEKLLRGSKVDNSTYYKTIEEAIQRNILVFDTAQDYGLGKCQKMIGKMCPKEIIISSKYTPTSNKYKKGQVRKSLEKDLLEMNRKYIDIYWLHLPNCIEDNMNEIIQLYKEGLIKNIGVSNFNLEECKMVKTLLEIHGIKLYGVQNHYSLLERRWEKEGLLDWCKENDILFFAWAPLEEGLLVEPKADEKKTIMKRVFQKQRDKLPPLYACMHEIANYHNITLPQVAISYVSSKGIIPIVGCRRPKRIIELDEAVNTVLEDDEIKKLEEVADSINAKVLGADLFRMFVKK